MIETISLLKNETGLLTMTTDGVIRVGKTRVTLDTVVGAFNEIVHV